jgi:glycosyltransferase involved in cell wall biosynthesis
MGDWVVLEGPLYGDEKVEFLEQFRYAIHTRADEPFGISLVELMKAGCIPFAPDSCGSAEILNHSALLFADTDQAVCKIGNVFADPDFSQSILSFLSHRTEAFSTDGFCESVVALVSSMIDRALPAFDFASSPAQAGSGRRGPYGN